MVWSRSQIGPAAAAVAKSIQSCPTLCDPIDGSPPGSPVPGILQARTLEWIAISFSNAWKGKVKVKSLSCVRLLAIPWTAAHQAPMSMGFSRQEHWSGLLSSRSQIGLLSTKNGIPLFSSNTCIEILREHCHSAFWKLIDRWDGLSSGDFKHCHVEGGVKQRGQDAWQLITRLLIPFLHGTLGGGWSGYPSQKFPRKDLSSRWLHLGVPSAIQPALFPG